MVVPGRYFVSHRLPLARAAMEEGWEVHVATPVGLDQDAIRHPGITVHHINLVRTIGHPGRELASLATLFKLCRQIRPTIIHALGPKACVLGGLTGRVLDIPSVMARGGIGAPETMPGLRNRLARHIIRGGIALSLSDKAVLIAQNDDERRNCLIFKRHRDRSQIVAGAGVDCDLFSPTPEPEGPIKVLFLGRLLRSKGVVEYIHAARLLKSEFPDAQFLIAGGLDEGSASAVTQDDLVRWQAEGAVKWLGHRADVAAVLSECHIVCVPSYAEGLPKSLAEAAAAGRCIVTTDAPGCRDVVEHGVNGLLVRPRSVNEIATALGALIRSADLRAAYGLAGRKRALRLFDQRVTVPQVLSMYRSLTREKARMLSKRRERYFSRFYPDRASGLGSLIFRHADKERLQILRCVVGDMDKATVLDAGCGDGVLLSSLVAGRPRLIQLEDICTRSTALASQALSGRADEVRPVCGDSLDGGGKFETVLAIGVLDYVVDSIDAFRRLRERSLRKLVVTVPRHHVRNWIRWVWFKGLGIPFSILSLRHAHLMASAPGHHYQVVKGPFEWVITSNVENGGGTDAEHP